MPVSAQGPSSWCLVSKIMQICYGSGKRQEVGRESYDESFAMGDLDRAGKDSVHLEA